MAPRRPKASINDVALPIHIETPATATTTGGLEADKPKKAPRKKPNYGRMELPDMGKRKLVSRIEVDENDPQIVTLNNALVDIQPDHKGWRIRDEHSHDILKLYGFDMSDPDFPIVYCRLHAEFEAADEDGFVKLVNLAYADPKAQCHFMLDTLIKHYEITDKEIIDRINRDACFPYITVTSGVSRIGHWMTDQIARYVATVTEGRIDLLKNPPAGMRGWGQKENQVLSNLYRSDAYYDAMGIDKD